MPGPFYEVDAPTNAYQDIRSGARSRKRGRDNFHKYVKFATVNRGQRFFPHADLSDGSWLMRPTDVGEYNVKMLHRREFWELARTAIRCRHHHSCPNKRDSWQKQWVEYKRGGVQARRTAHEWLKKVRQETIPQRDVQPWTNVCDSWSGDQIFRDSEIEEEHIVFWKNSYLDSTNKPEDSLFSEKDDEEDAQENQATNKEIQREDEHRCETGDENEASLTSDGFVYVDLLEWWGSDEEFVVEDVSDGEIDTGWSELKYGSVLCS